MKVCSVFSVKIALENFLDNNNGVETIREYLTKMEKESWEEGKHLIYLLI